MCSLNQYTAKLICEKFGYQKCKIKLPAVQQIRNIVPFQGPSSLMMVDMVDQVYPVNSDTCTALVHIPACHNVLLYNLVNPSANCNMA